MLSATQPFSFTHAGTAIENVLNPDGAVSQKVVNRRVNFVMGLS